MSLDSLDHKISKYTYKLKHAKNRNEAEEYQQHLQHYHNLKRGMKGGEKTSEEDGKLKNLLKSLEDDFDKVERARIFQRLKDSEPIDEALIGAKMLLEENNWDYTILQQAFDKTQDKIEAVALGTKQTQKRQPYLKYAAVLIPFVAIAGYFLLNTSKSIDTYFVKETGIPNLMSTSENDWNKLMQLYKSNELESAYQLSEEIGKEK